MKKKVAAGLAGLFIGISFSGCFIGSFAASYLRNLDTKTEALAAQKNNDIESKNSGVENQIKPTTQSTQTALPALPNQAKTVTQSTGNTVTRHTTEYTTASSSSKKTSTAKPIDNHESDSNELISLTKIFVNVLYNTNPKNLDNNFQILNSMGVPGGFMGSKGATDYFYQDMLDTTLVFKSINVKSVEISNTYESVSKTIRTTAVVYADIKCLEDGISIVDQCEFHFVFDSTSNKWEVCDYRWEKE
jgi:hypothetical protein